MDVGGEGHNHKYVCAHTLVLETDGKLSVVSDDRSVSRAESSRVFLNARTSGILFEPAEA